MKLINIILKKWMQHKKDVYTLKSKDYLSKSEIFSRIARERLALYNDLKTDQIKAYGAPLHKEERRIIKLLRSYEKYNIKSEHCKHLSEIYEEKIRKSDYNRNIAASKFKRLK